MKRIIVSLLCISFLFSNCVFAQTKQNDYDITNNIDYNCLSSCDDGWFEYNPYNDRYYLDFFDIDEELSNDNPSYNENYTHENALNNRDTVYLSLTSAEIEKGSTTVISCIYPSGSTVSYMYWLTTDPSIATISSSGIITGVNPGNCSVYVMTMINGTFYNLSCPIYVYLSDGVYYIKNLYSSKYLEVENGDISNSTPIQQYTKRTSNDNSKLRQMWKIHYLGNQSYSIRPMNIPVMPISTETLADLYKVRLGRNTINENGLYDREKWSFTYVSANYGSGLTISNKHLSGKTLQINTNDVNAKPYLDTIIQSTKILWEVEEVTGLTSQILVYDTSQQPAEITNTTLDIPLGSAKTLPQMKRVVVFSSPVTLDQTMSVNMMSNGTLIYNNSTSIYEALLTGYNLLYFSKTDSTGYATAVIDCHLFFPENTYYIMNMQNGKYITVDGSLAVNADLILSSYDGTNLQKWDICETSNGYYNIKSYSDNTFCIGTYGNSANANTDTVLSQNASNNCSQWRIAVTFDRKYKLILRGGEADNIVLYSSLFDSAIIDEFDEYYFTDWCLNVVDTKAYTNMYLGTYPADQNAYSLLTDLKEDLIRDSFIGDNYRFIYHDEFVAEIESTRICICFSHGSQTSIALSNNDSFCIQDLDSINSTDISDLDLLLFAACSTGEGNNNADNLVNAFYSKGVNCVIGFNDLVLYDDVLIWLPFFTEYLYQGFSIGTALYEADTHSRMNQNYQFTLEPEHRYTCGNVQTAPIY